MTICHCSLAGTSACITCPNNWGNSSTWDYGTSVPRVRTVGSVVDEDWVNGILYRIVQLEARLDRLEAASAKKSKTKTKKKGK